jgi:hypothetical protein
MDGIAGQMLPIASGLGRVTKSAFVRGGAYSATPQDSSTELLMKHAASDTYVRRIYVRIEGHDGADATLTLFDNGADARDFSLAFDVMIITGDFVSGTVTWDNAPTGSLLTTGNHDHPGNLVLPLTGLPVGDFTIGLFPTSQGADDPQGRFASHGGSSPPTLS